MIKAVLDTNVVVSALLKPDSKPELVLTLALTRQFELCLSRAVFDEYGRVLGYGKFRSHLDREKVGRFLTQLKELSLWVAPEQAVTQITDDPADNRFLECASAGEADFLVTGNSKHFPFNFFHRTRIVTPGDFLQLIAKDLFR